MNDGRSFSARDRRVIAQCVRDNRASLPQTAITKPAGGRSLQRGEIVPVETQRQLRSLPLTCDRELSGLGNDLERVIYGGQVMIIDSANRVVDVFEVTP